MVTTGRATRRDHKPLEPKLDECLRATLESLELPPLRQGDKVKVEFSFVFDDKDVR